MSFILEVEPSHAIPLVHFQFVFPGGALSDPDDLGGRTRLAARLLRRGTRTRFVAVTPDW